MSNRILAFFSVILLSAISLLSPGFESQASPVITQSQSHPALPLDQTSVDCFDSLLRDHQERERYKGITVNPHPAAKGAELVIQNRIAGLLSQEDFVPEFRIQRFLWIPERAETTITGWQGDILNVRPTPQGFLVDLRVIPRHDGNVGLHTSDYTVETYNYINGSLHYINSTSPRNPGVITFN